MKNTIIYVDGGNLYYGLLRGTDDKWLDLGKCEIVESSSAKATEDRM